MAVPITMVLTGVELVHVEIPFRAGIGTAVGVHRTRPLLFVRVVAGDAEGWGECAALSEGTSVDPALDDVERAAAERGVPRFPAPYTAAALPLAAA